MTATDDKNEIFNRLAHFIAPDNRDNLPEAILEFVLKQTLFIKEGLTKREIKKEIKDTFDLEFEDHEIDKATENLQKDDVLVYKDNKFYLSEKDKSFLNSSINKIKKEDEQFYTEVADMFIKIDPLLSTDEINLLTNDLEQYINHLFSRLGAEAVHFLYPSEKELGKILRSASFYTALEKLETRDKKIESFRKNNFAEILSNLSKGESKTFLSNKLNAVFIYTLASIDPKCSSYLQKTLKDYEIYLDTNVLYDLLGLNSDDFVEFAKRLLKIVKKFNFKVYVTARTLQEFNTSLSNSENFLRKNPLPTESSDLLKTGASVLDEAFIKAYWNRYADEKITLDEFLSFYKNIKPTLQKMGIELASGKATKKLIRATNDDAESLQTIKSGIGQIATYKNEPLLEHDAFHVLFIRKIREARQENGSVETKHWFLTKDRSVFGYELALSRKNASYSTSSVLIEHLMQILRPLLPRSDDYEQSLLSFVTEHHQAGFSAISPNLAVSILSRIDRYKTKPKDVAIKILTDTHFSHKLQKIKNSEKMEEAIDNELLKKAELAIHEKEEAIKQSQQLSSRASNLEAENKDLKSFKAEVEEKRKRKSSIFRWSIFVVINLITLTFLIRGIYYLINVAGIKGVSVFGAILVAFIFWMIILNISSRLLPNSQGEKIIREINDIWTQVTKITSLFNKKD